MKIILLAACLFAGVSSAFATHYEVFLLAGQSNMDGRGNVHDLVGDLEFYAKPRPAILINYSVGGCRRKQMDSGGFRPLQPGYSCAPGKKVTSFPSETFGPEVSFGAALAEALPHQHLLLIKFDEGGTNLRVDWNPDEKGKLYENFIAFVRKTQRELKERGDTFEIRGMLWHQGESDGSQAKDAYLQMLTGLIARVRSDLGVPDLPFLIGQLYDNGKRDTVISAQKTAAQLIPRTAFVESDGLTTTDKGTHFDAVSQIELGKRFAREMVRVLTEKKDSPR